MAKKGIHGPSRAHDAQHGERPCGHFGVSGVRYQGRIAPCRNFGVQFVHQREVFNGQDNLPSTACAPSFQQPRTPGQPNNINGSMSTLSGDFTGRQGEVLPDDEGHGWRIMHRRHDLHQSLGHLLQLSLIRSRTNGGQAPSRQRTPRYQERGWRQTAYPARGEPKIG